MPRPRDRYGRPLAPDAPAAQITPPAPEQASITSTEAWIEATSYLYQDLPFHAHEVFEQRWRCCPPEERDCWRALAQWGAALTHLARGNAKGSRQVASRARELFSDCLIIAPVDRDFVLTSLDRLMTDK